MKRTETPEIARVGYFSDKFEIFVETDDIGEVPHFHIKRNEFHTCIEIKTNKYFHHTGKEDVLNVHLRKELYKFLKAKDEYGEDNWIVLIKAWNRNNSNMEIDIKQKMPDYRKIE